MTYQLIVMSFDGEYRTEGRDFPTVEAAWEHSDGVGSRWFFYPIHFVVSESGKTIIDYPAGLEEFCRRRVSTVSKVFEELSTWEEAKGMDAEQFCWFVDEMTIDGKITGRKAKKEYDEEV